MKKKAHLTPPAINNEIGFSPILIVIILAIAIITGLIIIARPQIFSSQAASPETLKAFDFRDANGQPLNCYIEDTIMVCETSTELINVTLTDPSKLN